MWKRERAKRPPFVPIYVALAYFFPVCFLFLSVNKVLHEYYIDFSMVGGNMIQMSWLKIGMLRVQGILNQVRQIREF